MATGTQRRRKGGVGLSLAPRHPFAAPPDRMDGPRAAGAPVTAPHGRMPQHRAREVFGLNAQVTKLAEEAAELTAACLRWMNGMGDMAAIREEVVGVESVAMSLVHDLGTAEDWTLTRRVQRMKLEATLADVDEPRCRCTPQRECSDCAWLADAPHEVDDGRVA